MSVRGEVEDVRLCRGSVSGLGSWVVWSFRGVMLVDWWAKMGDWGGKTGKLGKKTGRLGKCEFLYDKVCFC